MTCLGGAEISSRVLLELDPADEDGESSNRACLAIREDLEYKEEPYERIDTRAIRKTY